MCMYVLNFKQLVPILYELIPADKKTSQWWTLVNQALKHTVLKAATPLGVLFAIRH